MKLIANIIAREITSFEALLFKACIESIINHVDGIVLIDNGCSANVLSAINSVKGFEDKAVVSVCDGNFTFSSLRQMALDETRNSFQDADYFFWTDADEVWFDTTLKDLRGILAKNKPDGVAHSMVHFVPNPFTYQHVEYKLNTFKLTDKISWSKDIHEVLLGVGENLLQTENMYHHYGYCKEQWRTAIKFLKYALIEHGNVKQYNDAEWLLKTSPNQLLLERNDKVSSYTGPFPKVFRDLIWIPFCNSCLDWADFLETINYECNGLWRAWAKEREVRGSWVETLSWIENILRKEVIVKNE